jgi:hypothetical protein
MRDIINDILEGLPTWVLFSIVFVALLCTAFFTWTVIVTALPLAFEEESLEGYGYLMNASFIVLIISYFILEDKDE